jgi:hypothetical protein
MTRRLCVLCLLLCGLVGEAAAQMDFRQASGIPRPVDDLPAGTISIRVIRGDLSNPVTNHPVELRVGDEAQTQNTDAEGRAEFVVQASGTLRASTIVDGQRLESQPFPAPGRGGIRMVLVALDKAEAEAIRNAVTGPVVFGRESQFVLEPGDERVTVYYVLQIVNSAKTPVNPPTPIRFDVPRAADSATIVEGPAGKATVNGRAVIVQGPFAPGATELQVAYSLKAGGGSIEIEQSFPVELEHVAVIARKFGDAKLTSPNIARQQEMPADGNIYIAAAGERALPAGQPLQLTLTGLPHHSRTPRNLALGLAGVIVLIGLAALRKGPDPDRQVSERKRLTTRKEKLLQELVRLEQDHRRGRIDVAHYKERRQELMEALDQVYSALSGGDAGAAA